MIIILLLSVVHVYPGFEGRGVLEYARAKFRPHPPIYSQDRSSPGASTLGRSALRTLATRFYRLIFVLVSL